MTRRSWEEAKPPPRVREKKPPPPPKRNRTNEELKVQRLHIQIVDANRDLRKYARLYVEEMEKGRPSRAEKYKKIVDHAKYEIGQAKKLLAELGEEYDDSNQRR